MVRLRGSSILVRLDQISGRLYSKIFGDLRSGSLKGVGSIKGGSIMGSRLYYVVTSNVHETSKLMIHSANILL